MNTPAGRVVKKAILDAVSEASAVEMWRYWGKSKGVSLTDFLNLWVDAEIKIMWDGVDQ